MKFERVTGNGEEVETYVQIISAWVNILTILPNKIVLGKINDEVTLPYNFLYSPVPAVEMVNQDSTELFGDLL